MIAIQITIRCIIIVSQIIKINRSKAWTTATVFRRTLLRHWSVTLSVQSVLRATAHVVLRLPFHFGSSCEAVYARSAALAAISGAGDDLQMSFVV